MGIFIATLFAEVIANDRPLLVVFRGGLYMPIAKTYAEVDFGGEFKTEAEYPAPEVQCLIKTGGMIRVFNHPERNAGGAGRGQFTGCEW